MAKPFFSVIIPLYNKSKYIERTINSVLNQSFKDFEIVVVDDGSDDDGPGKVKVINDSRIRLIRQVNKGVSLARNRGINESNGRYIAFLDADDFWCECHLQCARDFFNKFRHVKWYASRWLRSTPDKSIQKTVTGKPLYSIGSYFIKAYKNVWTSSVVAEIELVKSVGGFSHEFSHGEDFHFWYRVAQVEEYLGLTNMVTAIYLDTESSLTKSTQTSFVKSWNFIFDFLSPNSRESYIDPALKSFIKKRMYAYLLDSDSPGLLGFLKTYQLAFNLPQRISYKFITMLPFGSCGRVFAFKILNRVRII